MNDAFGKKLKQKLYLVYLTLINMDVSKEDAEDITQKTAIRFLQNINETELNIKRRLK